MAVGLQCEVMALSRRRPIRSPRWADCRGFLTRHAGRLTAGSGTGLPLAAAAMAGAGPAQASSRESSPLRNRWQRTPPVARPLAGYCRNSVTLTEPASVPGRARDVPDTVATTASARRYRAEVDDTRADAEFDAGHAASRAALRSYSRGGKVQQLGVVGDEDQLGFGGGEFNGADHPIARLEADHIPGVFAENLRIDPLHHTLSRAECQAQ